MRRCRTLIPLSAAAALALATVALGAQATPSSAPDSRPVLRAADSAALRRLLRSNQAAFEGFRRSHLPFGESGSGHCDARIGRYCYWRGDGEDNDDDERPPEAPEIAERRDTLLRELRDAERAIPGDAWVAGQRVRYLVDAGRFDDAIAASRTDCRATQGWCAALTGYAAQAAGRFSLADSAFRRALAEMPSGQRCDWLDLGDILDDDLLARLKLLSCDQRDAFARRLFWLASPLLSVSGTDVFTGQLARLTRARIAEGSADADGSPWGDDERELVARYGWPAWYTRARPDWRDDNFIPHVTGHDAGMPYDFLPPAAVYDNSLIVADSVWTLNDPRARWGYAPAYARTIHALPHQIARFRRGDSTLVVAAWDARQDTTLLGRPLAAALVLASTDSVVAIARDSSAGTEGRITALAPIDSGLVSLELLAAKDRRAARTRAGFRRATPGRVSLSDLLLYDAGAGASASFAAARDNALTSDDLPMPHATGVYWETYGVASAGEPVRFSLAVERISVSWTHRLAEGLHLTSRTSSRRLQWEEVPRAEAGIAARSVLVDLTGLEAGRYRIALTAATRDGASAVSSHDIAIR